VIRFLFFFRGLAGAIVKKQQSAFGLLIKCARTLSGDGLGWIIRAVLLTFFSRHVAELPRI
jgi:hypothetical protein